jgi:excisionase family DNA binding protein
MKLCPICGLAKDVSAFYRTSSYCKPCHKQRSREYRKQPHQRTKIRAAKNAWLKDHPEVNRRNVAAFRARRRASRVPVIVSPDHVLVREAVTRLGMTKQRVQQLIDHGQLAAIRERGRWAIDRADLERMLEQRAQVTDRLGDARPAED